MLHTCKKLCIHVVCTRFHSGNVSCCIITSQTDSEIESMLELKFVRGLKLLAKKAGDIFALNNSVLERTSFENTNLDDSRLTLGEITLDLLEITPIAKNPKRRGLTSNNLETIESRNNEPQNSSTPKVKNNYVVKKC